MAVSIKLFSVRNLKMEFRRQDMRIFNGTDSRVIGRKFDLLSVALFL